MTKFLTTAVSIAALSLLAGSANAADQNVDINATVVGFCTIAGVTGTATAATLVNLGSTFGAGGITAGDIGTATMGATICNKSANVTLSSAKGALLVGTGAAPVSGLQNFISYNAVTTGFSPQASVAATVTTGVVTATSGTAALQTAAFSAPVVTIVITPVANAAPLLVGTYTDTLTMTVLPTI